MKYYLQQNCNEAPIAVGAFKVQFEQVSFFAGQWWGVFATDNEAVIDAMATITGTRGIQEISQSEFENWSKKKGTRQTHTWTVTEPISGVIPSPTPQQQPAPEVRSAVSATADATAGEGAPTASDDIAAVPVSDHQIDDLLKTSPRDDSVSTLNYVSSQAALADALGISLKKFYTILKIEGAPAKEDAGYNVKAWESFLNKVG